MSKLTVFKFSNKHGAEQARSTLEQLQKEQLIRVLDAATLEWPEGAKKPKTRQFHNLAGIGALIPFLFEPRAYPFAVYSNRTPDASICNLQCAICNYKRRRARRRCS